MYVLMKCVAEAVMAKGLRGLVEIVPGGTFIVDVANEALKRLKEHRRAEDLKAEVVKAVNATLDEAKETAARVAKEVAGAAPAEDRLTLEMYLTQIPGTVRASLKRADDPSGLSVPATFVLNDTA